MSIAAAPAADWQKALALLQTFDPPGVGASSPTDALILQVERRITEGTVKTAVWGAARRALKKSPAANCR